MPCCNWHTHTHTNLGWYTDTFFVQGGGGDLGVGGEWKQAVAQTSTGARRSRSAARPVRMLRWVASMYDQPLSPANSVCLT